MFTLLIGRIGTVELIASNITLAINSLSFLPMLGISMAVTIVVGQHIGQERKWAAERAAYTGAKLAAGYMFFMGMLFVLFPSVFLWIFQGKGIDPEMFQAVARYTRRMLVLVAILGVADAANMTFNGALKGAGDTLFSMWANVVIAWVVFIPPVYLCTVVLHTHVLWPWSWFVLYVVLLGAVYWWRFALGRWKEIDIREPVPVAPPVETTGEARVVES
jgi:MATE family multidrug resistance protein